MPSEPIRGCPIAGARPDGDRRERPDRASGCVARWALLAFGWLNVALGIMGIVVPGMPTTVFLIVAAWAFSKCSERFHRWLWNHPRLGRSVRAWHEQRAIPLRAKVMAVGMMSASFAIVTAFVAMSWVLPAILAAVMLPACAYIVSRPGLASCTDARPSSLEERDWATMIGLEDAGRGAGAGS